MRIRDSPSFSESFLRVLRFSSLHKTNISKFQLDQDRGAAWKPAKADIASSLDIINLMRRTGVKLDSSGVVEFL